MRASDTNGFTLWICFAVSKSTLLCILISPAAPPKLDGRANARPGYRVRLDVTKVLQFQNEANRNPAQGRSCRLYQDRAWRTGKRGDRISSGEAARELIGKDRVAGKWLNRGRWTVRVGTLHCDFTGERRWQVFISRWAVFV